MNRQPYQTPPAWWSPRPSPFWMRVWRPVRRRRALRLHGLVEVEVRHLDCLAEALAHDQGVLVTPNHSSHADPFALVEAAERLGTPFYFMTAWQVFAMTHRLGRRVLSHHGAFSINREGHDVRAFRFAVNVLEKSPRPLVIFPEGEVFHLNDQVTPFRRGAATAAMLAARRSGRPVACVPSATKFQFLDDPTPQLLHLAGRLEQAFGWDSGSTLPLSRRILRLIGGLVARHEADHFGAAQPGTLDDRMTGLIDALLARLEARYRLDGSGRTVNERVKWLRFRAIQRLEAPGATDVERGESRRDLDAIFLAVQLYSYPVDYVAGAPSLERLAETLDKLEEDVLGAETPSVRGRRRAILSFGTPIVVSPEERGRDAADRLTRRLESRVQRLLDDLNATADPRPDAAAAPVPLEDELAVGAPAIA